MGRNWVNLSLMFWIFNVWMSLMFWFFFDMLVQCLQCNDAGSKAMTPVSPHISMFSQNSLRTFHWKNRIFCYSFRPTALLLLTNEHSIPPSLPPTSTHSKDLASDLKFVQTIGHSQSELAMTISSVHRGPAKANVRGSGSAGVTERQGFSWGQEDIKLLTYRMVSHITKG